MKPYSIAALTTLIIGLASMAAGVPRALAASITVTTVVDDMTVNGNCTLREAIQAANTDTAVDACAAGNGADIIQFAPATDHNSIGPQLGQSGEDNDENDNVSGDFDVRSDITVAGNGNTKTVLDGHNLFRIFDVVVAGKTLTLQNLDMRNGYFFFGGAALRSLSGTHVITDHLQVHDNRIAGGGQPVLGGAFEVHGTYLDHDSLFFDNWAQNTEGGSAYGGALYLAGDSTLEGTSLDKNTASSDSGPVAGGAIVSLGTLFLTKVTMNRDVATVDTGQATGGALEIANGTAHIEQSAIVFNQASGGNDVALGGGISTAYPLTIINSTIADNFSDAAQALGGGIFVGSDTLDLRQSTVDNNFAISNSANQSLNTQGGGIYVANGAGAVPIGSIIAGNTADTGTDCYGSIPSNGYNLIGNASDCEFQQGTGDIMGTANAPVNPLLSDPGSPIPLPGSPAIDHGSPTIGTGVHDCINVDQKGHARPSDGNGDGVARCDIGSRETDAADQAPVAKDDTLVVDENQSADGALHATDADGGPLYFYFVDYPGHGSLSFKDTSGLYTYTPDKNYSGSDSFTFVATDGSNASDPATVSVTVKAASSPPPSGGGGGGGNFGLLALLGLGLLFVPRMQRRRT